MEGTANINIDDYYELRKFKEEHENTIKVLEDTAKRVVLERDFLKKVILAIYSVSNTTDPFITSTREILQMRKENDTILLSIDKRIVDHVKVDVNKLIIGNQ